MFVSQRQRLLEQYLSEINAIPLLTPDEEVVLAVRIRAGDDEALHRLTRANLRFVVQVAKKYQGGPLDLTDLISEGNYGLVKAAGRFDETRGFKFISYAVWWIRQSILRALEEHGRVVRLPSNRIRRFLRVRKERERWTAQRGRPPEAEELAQVLDLTAAQVEEAVRLNRGSVSLDAPFGADDANCLLELLPNGEASRADASMLGQSVAVDIEGALARLQPREAAVLRQYYGLGRERPQTLDEVGRRHGLTKERIRQIKKGALGKLRSSSWSAALRLHLEQAGPE